MVVPGWLTLKIWDEQIFGRQKLLDDDIEIDIKISMINHHLEALKYVSNVVDVLTTNWQQSGIRIKNKFQVQNYFDLCHQVLSPVQCTKFKTNSKFRRRTLMFNHK